VGALQFAAANRPAEAPSVAHYGTWRSLVAHLTGGQGVVGSNPAVPTNVMSRDMGDW
jgi:hypothetical protein